jgi:predicted MarR family transcription regulator
MNANAKLTLAWTVAGILAVGLIVALIALANREPDLGTVLEDGREEVTAQRDRIREACNGTDAASQRACNEELEDLADILREFSQEIDRATSSVEVQVSTTSAQ